MLVPAVLACEAFKPAPAPLLILGGFSKFLSAAIHSSVILVIRFVIFL